MLQNPAYAAGVNAARAGQIEAEGVRILDTAASFGRPDNGNVNALLRSLYSDYVNATNDLSTALRDVRKNEIQVRWEPDANGVQLKKTKTYDLFWDVNKPLAARAGA